MSSSAPPDASSTSWSVKNAAFRQYQVRRRHEADEMLDMGFIEDIERILSATPEDKRMLMFSATMPKEVLSIAERFMRDYEIVRTKTIEQSNELTEQIYYEVRRENKFEALSRHHRHGGGALRQRNSAIPAAMWMNWRNSFSAIIIRRKRFTAISRSHSGRK
ncbi:MAG: DEAD/DEAH box helicase [Victivallales bacterium]